MIETKQPIKGEVPFKATLTGIFGVYEYIFTPVLGPNGEVEIIAGTTRDVTDRNRSEEALARPTAARTSSCRPPHTSCGRRSPRSAFTQNVARMLSGGTMDAASVRRKLESMDGQLALLNRLIATLLDVSRIAGGRLHLNGRS